ncbi:hypothetical protein D4765_14455 [Subtercola vilae]|uniref:Uncharacterized protein n=1 Tax=Subtercola vilae TaxID=2056433 RepID=A0A4T2BTA8_9MICO|nr:hypothetical protein D4765_14455 [Subtercola vilae]
MENQTVLVRNGAGEEVVSSTQIYTYPGTSALFAPDSRVTTTDGRTSRVITTSDNGFGSPVDHTAVALK